SDRRRIRKGLPDKINRLSFLLLYLDPANEQTEQVLSAIFRPAVVVTAVAPKPAQVGQKGLARLELDHDIFLSHVHGQFSVSAWTVTRSFVALFSSSLLSPAPFYFGQR